MEYYVCLGAKGQLSYHEELGYHRIAVAKTLVKMVKMRNTGSNAFHVIPPRARYPTRRWQKNSVITGTIGSSAFGLSHCGFGQRVEILKLKLKK